MNKKFQDSKHTIYFGESTEILKSEIVSNSIDLVFADPPYNIGKRFADFLDRWPSDEAYAAWAFKWLDECIRILKPDGSLYVMTSTQAMPYLDIYLRDKVTILSRIIWNYDSSGVQARNYYGSIYEPILFCVKDVNNYKFNADAIKIEAKTGAKRKLIDYRKQNPTFYNNKKVPGNVWYFPRVRYRMKEYENHPAQKPEKLLERIILASSNKEDIVLDPFAGSFTTAAVAKKLNRCSVSIESQKEYLKIGLRRVLHLTDFEEERLSSPEKSYARRAVNIKNIHAGQGELFDVIYKA